MKNNKENEIDKIINIQRKIAPEFIETLIDRHNILRQIYRYQPIGRRNLANEMKMGERIVRKEVMILKEQGFIDIQPQGMNLTKFGEHSLGILMDFMHRFKGLNDIEDEICRKLKIQKIFIVPGFYDEDPFVLREIGRVAATYIKSILEDHMVIGVTGGKTMATVANEMMDEDMKLSNTIIIPARGGMGKDVESQANTISAKIAGKIHAAYKLLYMPDNISKELLKELSENPEIEEVINYIKKIKVLVFGIGRADKMAIRRRLDEEKVRYLQKKGAVAESFGYYFNRGGEIVQEVSAVGVELEHYKQLKNVIGVAGGAEKAEAIISISKLNKNLALIMDEGLAREILLK